MTLRSGSGRPLLLDAQSGPARRIPAARVDEMVEIAMRRARAEDTPTSRVRPTWTVRQVAGWGAMLVLLCVTGTAGAVFLAARRWAPPAADVRKSPDPALSAPPKPNGGALREPVQRAEPDPNVEELATAGESPKAPQPPRESSDELLKRASELRAKHRWMDAARVYEQTLRQFPGSAEAYSASVSAGFLRLDHLGDPRGALRLLAGALRMRPDGALSEEARWGRIEAYHALGDAAAERSALRDFITRYPKSLFGRNADARLRDLADSP